MQPENNNSRESNLGADSSSLELPPDNDTLQPLVSPSSTLSTNRSSVLRFDRKTLLVAGAVAGLIVLAGVATTAFGLFKNGQETASSAAAQYNVNSLALNQARVSQELKVGDVERLAINGQLQVTNTVVVKPTTAPSKPTVGQIYYDSVTNQPYFYNGSQFISMAQTPPVAGRGITVNGTTILNTGVLSLVSGSPNVVITTDGQGNFTISDTSTSAAPNPDTMLGQGTAGRIAVFTGGRTLGNSALSQNGTTVVTDGSLDVSQSAAIGTNLNVGGAASITAGLTVGGAATVGGNLTVTGSLLANSLQQTAAGNDLAISAGNDDIVFTAGGRNFTLPVVGPASQTICTTGATCASGSGAAVILQPGAAQPDTGASSSIYINNTGGGNLIQLQGAGADRFVVSNAGTMTAVNGRFTALGTGIVRADASGNLSSGTVNLGTDTTGDYVSNFGSLTGLTTTGNSGEGSTPTLSVTYGSVANTAVQGNTTLTCAAGTGNLSGGGGSLTLGVGGSCGNLTIADSPTFAGSVTAQGSGGFTAGVASFTDGQLRLANAGSSFLGTLKVASLGQATTFLLPDPGAASATICLTIGNCAGTGTGVTTSGGTLNRLAKFTASQAIGDSLISDDGITVTTLGAALFQTATNSTTAFQIQNAAAQTLLVADTINQRLAIGPAAVPANGVLTVGTNTTAASGGLYFGTDTNLYRADVSTLRADSNLQIQNTSNNALKVSDASGNTMFNFDTATDSFINNGTRAIGNELENPGFELSTTANRESGWVLTTGATITNDSVNARSGNRVLVTTAASVETSVRSAKMFAVTPGETIYVQAYVKTAAGTNGSGGLLLRFEDKDYANPTFVNGDWTNPGTGYALKTMRAVVPAGMYYLKVNATVRDDSTTGTWYFDDFYVKRATEQTPMAYQNSVDSATAFQVQNASGSSLFTVDTFDSRLSMGLATSTQTLSLLGASGDLLMLKPATQALTDSAYINVNNGRAYFGYDGSTQNAIVKGGTSKGIDLVTNDTIVAARFDADGSVVFKTGTNSATAFQIQNAAGTSSLFAADTSTMSLTLNGANGSGLKPWAATTSMPAARQEASTVVANGYIYAIGGNNAGSQSTVYYARLNADGSAGAWSTNANALPTVKNSTTAVTANGYLYVLGGYGGSTSSVYYAKLNTDGSTGAWQTGTSLPAGRGAASAVVANGYVYLIGGDSAGSQSTVYYARLNADGSLGAWTTSANPLPVNRAWHSSNTANGYVYVIGGYDGASPQATVYYARLNADGTHGTWTLDADAIPAARDCMGSSAFFANGYAYVIGGSGGGSNSTVYAAKLNGDGSIGAFSTDANSLPAARRCQGIASGSGYVYSLGGLDSGSIVRAEVYYASTSRITVGGTLDLIGLAAGNLADGETGTGGELTAGNTNIVGSLGVRGAASFLQGVSIDKDLTVNGSVNFRTSTNSTTAFQIQNSTGTSLFTADTSGLKLQIGSATTDGTAVLLQLDKYNTSTDPTGSDGAMYYNTALARFRCYEDGSWRDCNGRSGLRQAIVSDLTNASGTVWSAITDMNYTLAASTTYRLKCELQFKTTVSTSGVFFRPTYGFTPTSIYYNANMSNTATDKVQWVLTNASNVGSLSFPAANTPTPMYIDAIVTVGAAGGTLGMEFHSENTDTITAIAGSNCYLTSGQFSAQY